MAGQVTGLLSERTPWRTLEGEATMPNKRPRGPQPHWRPKRETLRVLAAVEVVLDRYRDHLPVSLRQLFYVLLSDGVLAKTEHEYKRMCEYVGMARRSGRIAWDAIRDDTQIAVEAPASFGGPEDFWTAVETAVNDYRVDRQADQPIRRELWCETAGMVPHGSSPRSFPLLERYPRPRYRTLHLMKASGAFAELRIAVRLHPVRRNGHLSCVKRHRPSTDGTMKVVLQAILDVSVERSPIAFDPEVAWVVGVSAELEADEVLSGVVE